MILLSNYFTYATVLSITSCELKNWSSMTNCFPSCQWHFKTSTKERRKTFHLTSLLMSLWIAYLLIIFYKLVVAALHSDFFGMFEVMAVTSLSSFPAARTENRQGVKHIRNLKTETNHKDNPPSFSHLVRNNRWYIRWFKTPDCCCTN